MRCTLALIFAAIAGVTASGQANEPATTKTPTSRAGHNEIALYMTLRAKKNSALDDSHPLSVTVLDAGRPVPSDAIRLSRDAGTPLVTFVFDELEAADRRRAAAAAKRVLKGMGEDALPVAVWQAGPTSSWLQSYTTQKRDVEVALRLFAEGKGKALADAAADQEKQLKHALVPVGTGSDALPGQVALRMLARTGQITADQHLPPGIASLIAAAEEQKCVPGRKALVFFTAATPGGVNASRVLRSLFERLSDANVDLYVVDLRGLDHSAEEGMLATLVVGAQTSQMRQQISEAAKTLPGTSPSAPTAKTLNLSPSEFARMNDTISQIESGDLGRGTENTMAAVASSTGGGYTDADGDTPRLGRTLAAGLSHTYKLVFPAAAPSDQGGFHRVEVRVAEGGITVASPLGYLSSAPPTTAPEVSLEARAARADADWAELMQSAAAADLPLRAGVRPAAGLSYELAVQVPINGLQLRRDNTTQLFSLHVTVGAELDNSAGTPVARFLEDFDRRGALGNEAKVRETALTMSRSFQLPAGTYTLHARTRDWIGDKSGDFTTTVSVRSKEGSAFTASHPAAAIAIHNQIAEAESTGLAAALDQAEVAAIERGLTPAADGTAAPDGAETLIEAARGNALHYAETLPNFFCVERIDRSTDPKGTGDWKHHDALLELLRYQDKTESRTMLEVNGEKSHLPADRVDGARSNGEFGDILHTIFAPEAHATLERLRAMQQGSETLEVYRFAIAPPRSGFFVTDRSGSRERAGLHGVLYVDAGTQTVRRVLAQTDPMPAGFGVRSSWMSIVYDYIGINGHEYLLPVSGEVGLQQRKQEMTLLQLRFSDYRRFGSRARIRYTATSGTQ